jgi:glycosyltransferase involved in cell wall biosynthesis
MRILIATCQRNLVGGVEKYLRELLPELVQRGHDVSLAYERPSRQELETIDPSELSLAVWCLAELGREALLGSVARWNPDLVYSHGLEAGDLQQALLNAYPTVLFAHNYYGTCATGQKCHALPHAQPCTRRFGPACLALHYPRRCGGLHPGTMWRMYRQCAQVNSQLSDCEAILVASRHMVAEYQKHGINPDKLHLIPLPTSGGAAHFAEPVRRASQGRILFVGRLTKLKGGAYLIPAIVQAGKKLGRPLVLTVAGDGPERSSLQALARKLDVAADFCGWVDASQKLELMHQADLLAVPSVWPEPFGLVGTEAGSVGLPAVAYAVGGIPDWLLAGQSGEVAAADPPTVDGLADAIVRVLVDPGHYAKLCRGAWEVARRFTLDAHITKLEPILEAAARREPAGALRSRSERIRA